MFYILFEKLTNNFLQIFQNFLEKKLRILLYLLYLNIKIFVYFIQNLNSLYEKFTFIFSILKNFPHVYFEFRWISHISLKFSEIFPTIYSKVLKFARIFSQNFHFWNLFKYWVKILWMYKECTQNFLWIFQKFPNSSQNCVETYKILD